MSALRRNWAWIAATLLLAAAVHVASVMLTPHVIMALTMRGIASRAGLLNHMVHGRRPTAASRGVVRPSPDLLYSSCVYDLSGGPVRVHASGMPATYWSVSLFDADTDNFYVVNDRQAKTGGVDFLIVPPSQDRPLPGNVVRSPSLRGLVLVRTLIDDERHVAAIDAARRHAACEAYRG
ncbi:MAG TPA: DUF1254 domain-containing protein [Rhizomicrobium sp.]|jgi:uncharacterized membrane protein|nr:DUF1254 domain-containing protein [Rhizomicrobium sp.]